MAPSSPYWRTPRMWAGQTAYIIGGGPTVAGMDLSLIHGKRVIGVNNAFVLGDWVDVCWFGDSGWYDRTRRLLEPYAGLVVSCGSRKPAGEGVLWLKRANKRTGIDQNPYQVAWNMSSGASAINLAYHFGAKRIVLIGFDMQFGPDGKNNWHNFHPPKGEGWDPYSRFLGPFPDIKRDADRLGVEIVNVSPCTALTVFPRMALEDVV